MRLIQYLERIPVLNCCALVDSFVLMYSWRSKISYPSAFVLTEPFALGPQRPQEFRDSARRTQESL
jgi:hypothetical protein